MLTFDEAQRVLSDAADRIPGEIYDRLNGGIVLLEDTKMHPESIAGDLYILGEYNYDPRGLGRYISIYYGSFCKAHGMLPDDMQRRKLVEVLHHELTHHLESLAGDRSLEVKDAVDIGRYKKRHQKEHPDKSPGKK